jgi:hypothetical protein
MSAHRLLPRLDIAAAGHRHRGAATTLLTWTWPTPTSRSAASSESMSVSERISMPAVVRSRIPGRAEDVSVSLAQDERRHEPRIYMRHYSYPATLTRCCR